MIKIAAATASPHHDHIKGSFGKPKLFRGRLKASRGQDELHYDCAALASQNFSAAA